MPWGDAILVGWDIREQSWNGMGLNWMGIGIGIGIG